MLLALRAEPQDLEDVYRRQPDGFKDALSDAIDRAPADLVLQAWAARLDLAPSADAKTSPPVWAFASVLAPERARTLIWATIGFVVFAGTWAKLPDILNWEWMESDPFMKRYMSFYVVLPMLGVLWARYRPSLQVALGVAGAIAGLLIVQSVRTVNGDVGELSNIHMPLLLLSLGGVVALGMQWRNAEARLSYLQLVSETVALASILLLGGVVLTGLTAALFEAISIDIDLLLEWVVPYGALGVLPVGVLLASQRIEASRLAPLVARVFGPMALAVFAVYLPVLVVSGGLEDRDSLLALNVALIAVLALVILMEAERPDKKRVWTDWVAAALVVLALLADLAAFGSIAARLAGGLTPNRLAIVGLNVLVAAHLAGLVVPLVRRAIGQGPGPEDAWTARFMTVYALWSAAVVLVFPFLF